MNQNRATYKPAIIIPAFRRARSLSRLLATVNKAYFPSDDIDLIISLDKGAYDDVKSVAKNFNFAAGNVQIIEQTEKLGLKDHIIKCADYALQYDSIIVLEEDLIVSAGFYTFAQHALNHYENEESVAGISLYAQRFNETAQLPFEPLHTEHSTYFMKLVSSWGQAWTQKQWTSFKKWFKKADASDIEEKVALPDNIKEWNQYSWKKFFNAYLLEKKKYFVYPYSGFSTHCGDEQGEHIKEAGNLFQVPLSERSPGSDEFKFPEFKGHSIKYDMHMEASATYINTLLNLGNSNIAVDLYGTKSVELLLKSEYLLSSKKFKNFIQTYPLQFKPIELNIDFESHSSNLPFFYLYKTTEIHTETFKKPNHLRLAKYFSYQNFLSRNVFSSLFKNIFGAI